MSYKISYGESTKKIKNGLKFGRRLPTLAGIVLLLAIMARFFYPEETNQLTEALFPLTSDSSQQALEVFAENIKAGESFGDAVTAFCQEILNDADIS